MNLIYCKIASGIFEYAVYLLSYAMDFVHRLWKMLRPNYAFSASIPN